jgi:transcriptional regulator with XRE-family HTH domain
MLLAPSVGPPCAPAVHDEKYANGIAASVSRRVGLLGDSGASVKILDRVFNPREIRRRLGLNQEQFWTQIGVTQSGGSRYESGREMPRPVKELLRLVHVEQIDLSQVKRVDFEIISYLKESHPDLYRNLRRAVKGRQKGAEGASPFGADGAIPDDIEDGELAVTPGTIDSPHR